MSGTTNAIAALKARQAAAQEARTEAAAELTRINEQSAAASDAAEIARLNNRKAELQALIGAQATIEEEATATLETEEMRGAGIIKEPVVIRRATFDSLAPAAQMTHIKAGGLIEDPPKTVKPPAPLGEKAVRRANFDKMTPAARMTHIKDGGLIED